ncbi:T9SS type A sorting domain-containing protein [bacterium SCSIO 12643]|nr:T9SS type A sorting domain-containing protein [bacterium SCSIO 12643]
MKTRILTLFLLINGMLFSQNVTTLVGPNSGINDAIVVDSLGNIYGSDFGVSTTGGSSVYKIDTAGNVSTFSTGYSSCNGLAFDHQGNLYVVDFTSSNQDHQVYKLDQNGAKTAYGPKIPGASGIIFDPFSDTLYVSQYTSSSNSISKLAPDGTVSLYCNHSLLNGPVGMAYDDQYNLYVANFSDGEIYKVTHAGDSLEFIGKVPKSGSWGIGFLTYASGYLYATGIGVHKIYQISTNGVVTEFAGTGNPGNTNGNAQNAEFNRPNGIATNKNQDKLYISDYGTKNIRLISDIISDVDDLDKEVQWSVYPNPVSNLITIEFSDLQSRQQIQIYNANGQLVKTATIYSQVPLDVSDLPSGLYLIRMVNKRNSRLKFIKE